MIETGESVSRLEFTRRLLQEIDALYELFLEQGSQPIMAEWSRLCDLAGKEVQVDCGHEKIDGVMVGLAEDGALQVRKSSGEIETIYAGDVRPV